MSLWKPRARKSIRMRGIRTSLAILLALVPGVAAADMAGWRLLDDVEITEVEAGNRFLVEKEFPPALRAAAAGFEISGYVVPIVPEPYMTTFLLVERPEDCPFCGSGYGPSVTVEVLLEKPMKDIPEFSFVRLRGDLEFVEDPETMQLYRMRDAVVLPGS